MEDYTVCFEEDATSNDRTLHPFYTELEDMAYYIAKASNFTYSKKTIGGKMWTHMLISEECDIAVGLLSLHEQLAMAFLYSTAFLMTRVVILSGVIKLKCAISSLDINYEVMAGVAISIVILSVLSTLAEKIVSRISSQKGEKEAGLALTIWMYFSSLFMEPSREQVSASSKVALTFWRFSLVVILSVIGGTIKADMAAMQESQLETLQDILDHPKIRPLIPVDSAVSRLVMRESTIWKRIEETKGKVRTSYIEEYFDDMVKGKAMLIHDEMYILEFVKMYANGSNSKLHISKNTLFYVNKHIFTHDGVPTDVLEQINQKCVYFLATLQMTPRIRRMHRSTENYMTHEAPVFQSEIAFLIYIYVLGVATSAIIFLLEIFYPIVKFCCSLYICKN